MIAHILKLMGRRVGMTSTDGIVIDGRMIKKGDMSGPEVGPDGPPEPDRRHGRLRGRPGRHPARGPGLRPQRRGRRDQRDRRPHGPGRDHLARPAGQRQGRRRRRRAALGNGRCSTPTIRSSPGWAATRPAGSSTSRCRRRRARRATTGSTATVGRGGAAFSIDETPEGDLRRPAPRRPDDADPVHPPDPRHVRRARPG